MAKDKETEAVAEKVATGVVKVRSRLGQAPDGLDNVVLWERNEAHPQGEILIAGKGVFEVAETPRVLDCLRRGLIEKVAV